MPCAYEDADIPTGGTVYRDGPSLEAATFVEAILEGGSGGSYRLAGSGTGMRLIDSPSDTPAIERFD